MVITCMLVAVPTVAAAEPASYELREPGTAQVGDVVASAPTPDHIVTARYALLANGNVAALAQSRTIYLNHTGVTLHPGSDDSRTNASSIVSSQVTIPAWNTSATTWAATVACFRNIFAPFNVTITEQDPGNVPHIEAVFGGSPQTLGMSAGVGGVSPFTTDCGVIENSVVFAFTAALPDDAQTVCEVMAQEVAHSYGLDHELLASDPMTYLDYNGKRTFKDQAVSCGEYSARACGIGGSTCRANQNSVALLTARVGAADTVPPTIGITAPGNNAMVAPGFEVDATAADNIGVTTATLYLDNVSAGVVSGGGPFVFHTDAALAAGVHAIKVEASDGHNQQAQTIMVTVAAGGGGGGNGGGGGSGGGGGDDTGDGTGYGVTTGGCSTSGGGAGLALGLLLLVGGYRRRA